MTAIDYVCRLSVFLPWHGAGLLCSVAMAAAGAPAWAAVIPAVVGFGLGCFMPRGPL